MPHETSLVRFGVIADPQYAPLPPNLVLGRHFDRSLAKLEAAVEILNESDLSFVVTLGDIIDRGHDNYAAALERYAALRHESVFLPGNHDFLVEPQHLPHVHARLSMPARYHSFRRGGLRFVVIDGSEEALFSTLAGDAAHRRATERLAALRAACAVHPQTWNRGVGEAQLPSLSAAFPATYAHGSTVVVRCHSTLYS